MTDRPVTDALRSPGFQVFWKELMDELNKYVTAAETDARDRVKLGDGQGAMMALTVATAAHDLIKKIQSHPTVAREREKEKYAPARPEHEAQRIGYDHV